MVELVDTRDLKSSKATSCRFKSGPGYHKMNDTNTVKDKVDLEVDIQELFLVIWGKKYQILLTTFVFAVASIIYSLSLSNYFQSESILVSKDSSKSSSSLGQYSDLAALAGFSLETGDNKVYETIEIIKSREFKTPSFV